MDACLRHEVIWECQKYLVIGYTILSHSYS